MKTDKTTQDIQEESDFEKSWTLENALYILGHPTVESSIWSEAVEWLMLYGPEEVKQILTSASDHAMQEQFPEIAPKGYSRNGELIYDIKEIARSLGIEAEEVQRFLADREKQHGMPDDDSGKVH